MPPEIKEYLLRVVGSNEKQNFLLHHIGDDLWELGKAGATRSIESKHKGLFLIHKLVRRPDHRFTAEQLARKSESADAEAHRLLHKAIAAQISRAMDDLIHPASPDLYKHLDDQIIKRGGFSYLSSRDFCVDFSKNNSFFA